MRDIFDAMACGALFVIIFTILAACTVSHVVILGYGIWSAYSIIRNHYRLEAIRFGSRRDFLRYETGMAGWKNAVPAMLRSCVNGRVEQDRDSAFLAVCFWIGRKIVGTIIVLLLAAVTLPIAVIAEAGFFLAGRMQGLGREAANRTEMENI